MLYLNCGLFEDQAIFGLCVFASKFSINITVTSAQIKSKDYYNCLLFPENLCDIARELPHMYSRTVLHRTTQSLCDRNYINPGGEWFKTGGYDILTSEPNPNASTCGTETPLWTSGKPMHYFWQRQCQFTKLPILIADNTERIL